MSKTILENLDKNVQIICSVAGMKYLSLILMPTGMGNKKFHMP